MSREEQEQLDHLREQLSSAHTEARMYRGLFWFLLALSGMGMIINLLHR